MQSKADLHVHSKYSDRPSEWILRRMGTPESFVEPLDVYRACRERGMDFVTITDHNRIDGALEIAHLPGTFVSAEVTTYFPENGCKVHCLAWDISERQFGDIQRCRESVYDLRDYLADEDILHAIAHPFLSVNGRLTLEHLEKLIVMFNRFELINATEHRASVDGFRDICSALTPEKIERLACHHDLEPLGETPWVKQFTGGSDDHSGVDVADAHTETPGAADVRRFLDHLRHGRHQPHGRTGTSLRFAHGLYHIAYGYFRDRLVGGTTARNKVMCKVFEKLLDENTTERRGIGRRIRGAIGDLIGGALLKLGKRRMSRGERTLVEEFSRIFQERNSRSGTPPEARTFRTASRISQHFAHLTVERLMEHVSRGQFADALQSISSLAPVALGVTPYLAAFKALHKDGELVQSARREFGVSGPQGTCRAVWLADVLAGEAGRGRGAPELPKPLLMDNTEMTTVLSIETDGPLPPGVVNFEPVGTVKAPEGKSRLAFPPFLEVLEFIERQGFDEIYIATPGPLGLTGLLAARLLGLRAVGVFRNDFRGVVREVTGDDNTAAQLTWRYLAWFYGQTDSVLAADDCIREELCRAGLDEEKLAPWPELVGVAGGQPFEPRGVMAAG